MDLKKFLNLRPYLFVGAMTLALAVAPAVQASLIIVGGNATANTPSIGNFFDINLTNTGPNAISLGGFSLEFSVADAHVSFTSATTATALPYVFAGRSQFGSNIDTATGQTLDASDLWNLMGATPTIGIGATLGLAHVLFNVSAGAPLGPLTVSFAGFGATSLSDVAGNDLVADLQNGRITITGGTPLPEPATLALFALPALFLARRRFRH